MPTSNMYLFKYNNYLNKILKRGATLQDYGTPLVSLSQTNFNPNNYISTRHVFNTTVLDEHVVPDYCLVCDASDNIISRWFVMSVNRIRGGQWQISLLADLAADYMEALLGATCFIQKGYTASSPFVFNNENMGFNQIKMDEIKLENNLGTPWLVLYLARYQNAGENGEPAFNHFTGSFADEPTTKDTDYVLESLDAYKYSYYRTHSYTSYNRDALVFGAEYKRTGEGNVYEMTQQYIAGESGFKPKGLFNEEIENSATSSPYPTFSQSAVLRGEQQHWSDMAGIFNDGVSSSVGGLPINSYTSDPAKWYNEPEAGPSYLGTNDGYNTLMSENGKTIKVGDTIYRIDIIQEGPPSADYGVYKINKNSALGGEMRGDFFYYNGIEDIPDNAAQNYWVHIPLNYPRLSVSFVEIGGATASDPITYDFSYTKAITKDASYEIIAAPYNSITFEEVPGQEGPFGHNGDIALQWFQNIINKYNGANFAYDLQLVPYVPIDLLDLSRQNVIFCQRGTAKLALAVQLQMSSFSTQYRVKRFPSREDLKLSNELDVYRLVSPNGIGEYEWSPAKNGTQLGSLPYFEADCTLIPFHPYIKINPYFGGLYGKDYNDYRGLICGGDFSLPIVNNAWETYQLNNKYYQDIFDRNIEHQEYNNKFAHIQDIISATTGTAGGAMQGVQAGMTGGPVGMIAGGISGGTASAVGGIADVFINQKLRQESIDYQKDQFGFDLGTIKARSQSLTRTTAFNRNNKYFPYIEYYTCTDQEKKALQDKIKYNGMTIGVIGKIPDYLNPEGELTFVQGTIIDIDIEGDAEIADRLNQILQGGLRIQNV